MSFTGSLYSGVSGIRNHQTMMDVIGNNISNVNTVGFKSSRVTFADSLGNLLSAGKSGQGTNGGSNPIQVGLGASVSSIDRNWTQGTRETTSSNTDLAIKGQGLFIVKNNGKTLYQRAGNFTFDNSGKLVSSLNGAVVQGKVADANGNIPTGNSLSDIVINLKQKLSAEATKNVEWTGNLASSTAMARTQKATITGNLDPSTAINGSTTSGITKVYNQDGTEYNLELSYTKTADNTWKIGYSVKDSTNNDLNPAVSGSVDGLVFETVNGKTTLNAASLAKFDGTINNITVSGQSLNFNIDGTAITQNSGSGNSISVTQDGSSDVKTVTSTVNVYDSLGNENPFTLKFQKVGDNLWKYSVSCPAASGTIENGSGTISFNADGSLKELKQGSQTVSSLQLKFNPATGANQGQIINFNLGKSGSLTGLTQTSSSSGLSILSQDGSASASLSDVSVNQYGVIEGVFTNGKTKSLGKVMLANFVNQDGLQSVGDNLWDVSPNSGTAVINEFGADSGTTVQSQALEQSNVDISEEFSRMIIAQRGFQANARVITTTDSMLQEVSNLIR